MNNTDLFWWLFLGMSSIFLWHFIMIDEKFVCSIVLRTIIFFSSHLLTFVSRLASLFFLCFLSKQFYMQVAHILKTRERERETKKRVADIVNVWRKFRTKETNGHRCRKWIQWKKRQTYFHCLSSRYKYISRQKIVLRFIYTPISDIIMAIRWVINWHSFLRRNNL